MLKFPWGEDTHFIEKLWAMYIKYTGMKNIRPYYLEEGKAMGLNIDTKKTFTPKLHTIRGQSDRFKVDQFIQPFTWTYKPYKKNPDPTIPAQFDFMPPLKIVSKQRFEIKSDHHVYIDDICQDLNAVEKLAINDGFKDVGQFFRYFNKPVENMEIRHFTELKY